MCTYIHHFQKLTEPLHPVDNHVLVICALALDICISFSCVFQYLYIYIRCTFKKCKGSVKDGIRGLTHVTWGFNYHLFVAQF